MKSSKTQINKVLMIGHEVANGFKSVSKIWPTVKLIKILGR